jgi:hypothetical protein
LLAWGFAILTALAHGGALPSCISGPELETILEEMRKHPRSPKKYDGYRRALAGDTDDELLARLAYAETLAAGCSERQSAIAPRIVEAIGNRVRIRGGDVKSVVFERDQFASSLNNYRESRFRDFLCPKDEELWRQVLQESSSRSDKEYAADQMPGDSVHYYFFQHSGRFTPPAWAEGPKAYPEARFPGSLELRACVRFFRNSSWR